MKNINNQVVKKAESFNAMVKNSDKVVGQWFDTEIALEKSAKTLGGIITDNITTAQGRIKLARIGLIKLIHQGEKSAKSFKTRVSQIGKELGVKHTMKLSVKNQEVKFSLPSNSGKGGNNQKDGDTTAKQPHAMSVDAKKVISSIEKAFASLSIADQSDLLKRLTAEHQSKVVLAGKKRTETIKKVANQK